MRAMDLHMGLSGPDTAALFDALCQLPAFRGVPAALSVDNKDRAADGRWRRWAEQTQVELFADFSGDLRCFLYYYPGHLITARWPGAFDRPETVLELLAPLPFSLASFATLHPSWWQGGYRGFGFANLHQRHGWACAFKGEGHKRLVSRRWLDHGPWRLLRGAEDTSLVQFHDLAAGAEEALRQARPGHERMGISETGGFLQIPYVFAHDVAGIYLAEQRELRVVVHGRAVTEREMTDSCAVRAGLAPRADRPVDEVTYVFMEEDAARAHLHQLWLRELQCRALIDGRDVRLDVDYQQAPTPPDWVRRLEGG